MKAADDAIAAIFYVCAVLLGKYVLLNLLVAILVENYSSLQGDEGDKRRLLEDRLRSQGAFVRAIKAPFDFLRRCLSGGARPAAAAAVAASPTGGRALGTSSEAPRPRNRSVWAVVQQLIRGPAAALRPSSFLRVESLPSSRAVAGGGDGPEGDAEADVKGAAGAAHGPAPCGAGGDARPSLEPIESQELEEEEEDDARRHSGTVSALYYRCCLGCARGLTALDEALLGVYEHDWFPFAMVVAIMASCVVLALDCPGATGTGPRPQLRVVVEACEALFIGAMAYEQVYRVKSLGGVWTYDGSYLTRLWDWFDLFVIASSLIALCIPYPSAAAVAANAPIAQAAMAAKVARGFRPITLIPRINGLAVVVDTLGQALSACSGVLSVLAVFYLVFGILGVSLFSGVRDLILIALIVYSTRPLTSARQHRLCLPLTPLHLHSHPGLLLLQRPGADLLPLHPGRLRGDHRHRSRRRRLPEHARGLQVPPHAGLRRPVLRRGAGGHGGPRVGEPDVQPRGLPLQLRQPPRGPLDAL